MNDLITETTWKR